MIFRNEKYFKSKIRTVTDNIEGEDICTNIMKKILTNGTKL